MPALQDAAALQKRAQRDCDRGRFDLAERRLQTALSRLTSLPQQGSDVVATTVRVLVTLSTVEVELHGQDSGRSTLEEAHRLAAEAGDPALGFAVHNALALRALRFGRTEEALAEFGAAEELSGSVPVADRCILLLNRGNLHLQSLRLDAARSDLQACVAAAQRSGEPELATHEFMAQHNLGWLEFLAGNLPAALRRMDRAAAQPAGTSLAISALDRARVLIEAGLSDAADRSLAAAAAEFRRGHLQQELAETELARAECAVLRRNATEARRLALTAYRRFRRRGNSRWADLAELTLLGIELSDGRHPGRLVERASALSSRLAAQHLDQPARTASLVACGALVECGQAATAQQRLEQLGPISDSEPLAVTLQHRGVRASLASATGHRSDAAREIRLGLAELARHQARFGSIDLQTASAVHGRDLVRLDLDLALADPTPARLFNAIERGRAVSRRLTPVTPPSAESAPLLAELRQLTEAGKAMAGDPAAGPALAAVRDRMAEIYRELSAVSWRAAGAGAVTALAPMARVAAVAENSGRTLVSFCQHRSRWSAVVLGAGRPRVVGLPGDDRAVELVRRSQADLTVLAYPRLADPIRRSAAASLRRCLDELDWLLVRPLQLPDQPVALVPTGSISTLAWNCLPSLRGHPVEVAPTATSWLRGTEAVDLTGDVRVTVFAGPDLAAAPRETAGVARVWAESLAPPATADGMLAEATRGTLVQALEESTVVHVAAHGSHQPQNPLFSSLTMADGPLFAYELSEEQMAAHVVLSACELGQATLRSGDEALGLTRVLLQLGAQCVVAGVSQVDDDCAAEVMVDYHQRLAAGDDSATALAAATERAGNVPFVCFGSSWRAVPGPRSAGRAGRVAAGLT